MSIILVTGGTGFIGSNLLRKLNSKNNELHSISRNIYNDWRINDIKNDIKFYDVDISNFKELQKILKKINPDLIYHLASSGVRNPNESFLELNKNNILGSYNLFSISSKLKIKRIINVGSVFEYNQINSNEKKISNNSKYPLTLYGISKLTQTCLANHFFQFESLPITTLRLFTPYGMFEHNGRLISDIMLSSLKNKKLKIMSPHASRDFIFISDVIDGLISASKNSKAIGKIMDIGSGKSITVNEIIDISKNFLNFNVELINEEKFSHNYDQFSGEVSADISQTKKLINWKPKTPILEGLKITYSWYKKNISLYKNH